MVQSEDQILNFLVDMKLLFGHGRLHLANDNRFHRRLAIHHFHYVVEQVLREKAKDEEFRGPLRKSGFDEVIKKLNKKKKIPDFDNLLRLNTARNNVEHDNIVPDQADVVLYERAVERFMQWACNNYFGIQYADLVQERLVAHPEIRQHFITARECLTTDRSRFARELANAFVKFVAAIFRYFRAVEFEGGVTIMSGMGNALVDAPALTSLKLLFFRDRSVMNLINLIHLSYPKDDPTKPAFFFDKLVELFNASDDPKEQYDKVLDMVLAYQDQFPFLAGPFEDSLSKE